MPVKLILFERTAVYTLNDVPGPILDRAGLVAS